MPQRVDIINASTVLEDEQIAPVVIALQKQVSVDFSAAWDEDVLLAFVPRGSQPTSGNWQLVVLDNSDQAGALGYHDFTSEGLPIGKVFAGTDLQYGNSWSVTMSHELLELLADPEINLCAQYGDRLYAYEVCDPVEDDSLGYLIDGVLVSDFVCPSWFSPNGLAPYDKQGRLAHPFKLADGGYISVLDFGDGQGWKQIMEAVDDDLVYQKRAHVGSRRERRRIGATHPYQLQRTALRRMT